MASRTAAPYGSWQSPFPIELLVAGRVGLVESRFDINGKSLVWLESRPEEDGRQVLVRWSPGGKGNETGGGTARDISPAGMNVRNRVHEYGGASYLVAGDLVLVRTSSPAASTASQPTERASRSRPRARSATPITSSTSRAAGSSRSARTTPAPARR